MNIEFHESPLAPAPIDRYTPNGLLCKIAVQCVDPETGIVGDFLFAGESHREKGARVSPVYDDLSELYRWMAASKYEHTSGYLSTSVYRKTKS